jgi:hypothetical protein
MSERHTPLLFGSPIRQLEAHADLLELQKLETDLSELLYMHTRGKHGFFRVCALQPRNWLMKFSALPE